MGLLAPDLTLMPPAAPQRRYDLREVVNALRWIRRTGARWRMLPTNFPRPGGTRPAVYQQTRRWLAAGCFAAQGHGRRARLRWTEGRPDDPTAVLLDGRTVQSTPTCGARAGDDGHKRRKGSKTHAAVDAPGHRLALRVTPASEQERDQVGAPTAAVPAATGASVAVAFVA